MSVRHSKFFFCFFFLFSHVLVRGYEDGNWRWLMSNFYLAIFASFRLFRRINDNEGLMLRELGSNVMNLCQRPDLGV